MMSSRLNWLLIGLITVAILTGIIAILLYRDKHQNKVLGEAMISVYQEGVKTILNSQSLYYKELQLACEEMLTSAESLYLVEEEYPKIDLEEIKKQEWVIELTYAKPIEVTIPLGIGPTTALPTSVTVSQYLIPLSGRANQIEATGVRSFEAGNQKYVVLFFVPSIALGDFQWDGLIGTNKGLHEIEDILTHFYNDP